MVDLLLDLLPITSELLGEERDELFLLEQLVHLALLRVVDEVGFVLEESALVQSEVVECCTD